MDKFPEDAGLAVQGPHFEKHGQGGEGSPAADRAPSLGIVLKQWRGCRLILILLLVTQLKHSGGGMEAQL